MNTGSFWGDKNVLEFVVVMVMDAELGEYTKKHWTVHFRRMNFMAYELYLNYLKAAVIYWATSVCQASLQGTYDLYSQIGT